MVYAVPTSRRVKRKIESFSRAREQQPLPDTAIPASPFKQEPFNTQTRTVNYRDLYTCQDDDVVSAVVDMARLCQERGITHAPTVIKLTWRALLPFQSVYHEQALIALHLKGMERLEEMGHEFTV